MPGAGCRSTALKTSSLPIPSMPLETVPATSATSAWRCRWSSPCDLRRGIMPGWMNRPWSSRKSLPTSVTRTSVRSIFRPCMSTASTWCISAGRPMQCWRRGQWRGWHRQKRGRWERCTRTGSSALYRATGTIPSWPSGISSRRCATARRPAQSRTFPTSTSSSRRRTSRCTTSWRPTTTAPSQRGISSFQGPSA